MKVANREVYQVEIALGRDPSNVRWSQLFLGVPTKEKIMAYFEHRLRDLHRYGVNLRTGLPSEHCTVISQCRFLVSEFGLPEAGLAKQCLEGRYNLGHIIINRTTIVIQVD